MSKLVRFCLVSAVVTGLAGLVPAASQAGECKNFAAVGSGVSKSVATLMAKQGAVNVAEARGFTVQGEAKLVSCAETGIFGTECTAKTHACKMPH